MTWRYNAEHENVRQDFVRDLIDHAHTRGIKVLLGFTPFGYDGVNHYPLEHPETEAVGKDGKPVGIAGIGCWGYNLCPSKPESQRFMLDYVREMLAFYPNADGLMIESSDYAICHCPDCGPRFFEKEFAFVRTISDELWLRNRTPRSSSTRTTSTGPMCLASASRRRSSRSTPGGRCSSPPIVPTSTLS